MDWRAERFLYTVHVGLVYVPIYNFLQRRRGNSQPSL